MMGSFRLACAMALATLACSWSGVADAAETRRVSVTTAGEQADDDSFDAVISADGRFVAFESQSTNLVPGLDGGTHVFLHDLATSTTTVVDTGPNGLADGDSSAPAISSDGRYVAFQSRATNLLDLGATVASPRYL